MYNISNEPIGEAYRNLMDFSLGYCESFQLVIRDANLLCQTAKYALIQLEPFLLDRSVGTTKWHGTELLYGTDATVNRYNLTPDSVRFLKNATDRLYGWIQPVLPEDLCLIRPNGDPWLVSISHEKDSYLLLTAIEKDCLCEVIPEYLLLLKFATP